MEKEIKHLYLEKGKSEPRNKVYLDADNADDWVKFESSIISKKNEIEKERKKTISRLKDELYSLSRIIVEDVKTKKQAREIKQLLRERLNIFAEFGEVNDENRKAYDKLKDFANNLLQNVEDEIHDLPEYEIVDTLPQLTRVLTKQEQNFLFQELNGKKFIECSYESFCYAFGGTFFDNFEKIKWLSTNKQSLRNLLISLMPVETTIADIIRRADLYFINNKGAKINLPRKDRKHETSIDEDLVNKIIIQLQRLKISATI